MRTKLCLTWAALRWLLMMGLIAPALQAPLVAHPSKPVKPLRVWKGTASWYGPGFHGKLTANGEVYDMFALTAAHPSLPFGSLVRLVNTHTGKSQLVRINDRGPYIDDREIDVSYGVACRLGMEDRGLALVQLELLEVPPRRSPPKQSGD
jgi:rare lipoprotein A